MPFKRKLQFIAIATTFFATVFAAIGDTGTPQDDENYKVSHALEREAKERFITAETEFYENPRESTLSISAGGMSLFGTHGAISGGDGWGVDITMLLRINSDIENLNLLFGGSLFAIQGSKEKDNLDTTVRSSTLIFTAGAAYDFSQNFSVGLLIGYSFLGATYMEKDVSPSSTETTGTMSSIFSIKPYAEFMLNKNLSIYAAYRFFYISPALISSATNWGDIEVGTHAVEFGICYRF